jgi:hypothetical protein
MFFGLMYRIREENVRKRGRDKRRKKGKQRNNKRENY